MGCKVPVEWLPVGSNIAPSDGHLPGAAVEGLEDTVGYFGMLDHTRGLEDLFEAIRILRQSMDARLVMIGSASRPERYETDRGASEALRRYTELPTQLGIADAVTWTAYLPDDEAASLLGSVSVCALPYRVNTIGRSALAAALAVGTPVVLAGTPPDIAPLEDGVGVALVPRRDPRELAARLESLLTHPDELERLRSRTAEAAAWFDWSHIAATALDPVRLDP